MKFFEWASFLLASVVSGGDIPSSFDSVETFSVPKIVTEKQISSSMERASSKTRDIINVLREDISKNAKSIFEEKNKSNEVFKNDPRPLEPGVTLYIPENSSLVVEEQVEIRMGDKFAAVIIDPVSGEIFSQSEWVEVKK